MGSCDVSPQNLSLLALAPHCSINQTSHASTLHARPAIVQQHARYPIPPGSGLHNSRSAYRVGLGAAMEIRTCHSVLVVELGLSRCRKPPSIRASASANPAKCPLSPVRRRGDVRRITARRNRESLPTWFQFPNPASSSAPIGIHPFTSPTDIASYLRSIPSPITRSSRLLQKVRCQTFRLFTRYNV